MIQRLRTTFRHPLTRAIIALIGVIIIGVIFNAEGAFFKWRTHRDMLRQISEYGMLACGMTIVIITGGIDLSVGSVLAVAAVIFSTLTMHLSWSAPLAILATIAAGAVCGLVSGTLVARFRIQPFIATLAMMVFARGLAKTISEGKKVTSFPVPHVFDLISAKVLNGDVAVVTLIFLVCLLISWIILSRLRWGRYLYAIGGNEEASRLSGVPVGMIKLAAYGLSGLFSAVAGICHAAQEQQGDPEAGNAYELTAIAMVVIGGTSLSGGRGSIWFTLIGALTIGYLDKILSINAQPEDRRLMLTGLIIVIAVIFQRTRK